MGSATGMHADMLARSWLVWELTGSFTAVAGVNVARGVPMLAFGLFGGVIADRFDRKKVLLILQTWTMFMHAVMAALVISGHVELWHIYGLAALLGISMSMNQPVRTSIIPELVGKERMLNAITLNSMAINGTRFIGPAAVAFIIGWQGVGAAYIVSASMYLLVVMATLRIRLDFVKPLAGTGNMVAQLFEGFRYMAGNRLLLTLILLGLGPLAIGIAHRSLLPGLVSDVLGQDVEMLGILQSAGAAGSLVAAVYLGSKTRIANRGYLMLGVTAIYGLALLAIGGSTVLWLIMPLYIASAMSQTIFRSANTMTLMEITPARLQRQGNFDDANRPFPVTRRRDTGGARLRRVGSGSGILAARRGHTGCCRIGGYRESAHQAPVTAYVRTVSHSAGPTGARSRVSTNGWADRCSSTYPPPF